MITGINEWRTLKMHISCKCKCKFDGKKCNSDQWWNNDKCQCDCKKCHVHEKKLCLESRYSSCENGKYLASIMDDSAIICDEFIYADMEVKSYNQEKFISTNFNDKKSSL